MIYSFFLGANTPLGFYSLFPQLEGFDLNVIKGSSGSGKSTLIRSLTAKTPCAGICEKILCSSDMQSLDGAVFHEENIAVVDGTVPHTAEISGLGKYIVTPPPVSRLLEKRAVISSLKNAKKSAYNRAYKHLSGYKEAEKCLLSILKFDLDRLVRRADGIVMREACGKNSEGRVHRRFLDSVSGDGFVTLWDTVKDACNKVYVIDDKYRLSGSFMARSEALFKDKGYEIFSCMSPFSPEEIRHIIVPELSLAFVTRDIYSKYPGECFRSIHTLSYVDKTVLRASKQKIKLFEKLMDQLFSEAVAELKNARRLHQELEGIYRPYLDIEALNKLAESTALL